MFQTVKQTIDNLPEEDFSIFYQKYIMDSQDAIIEHDVALASSCSKSLDDALDIMKGVNILVKELQS